jgi:short-subunit dehydrogenase
MARELVPGMVERGTGHLVFVSSLSGKAHNARASLYSATKFGLRGFALCLRDDLRGTGVGVSVVSPGFIRDAGMFADSGRRAPAAMGSATADQVGGAVVEAIERDKGEITVAPLRARVLTRFAMHAPEVSSRVAGRTAARVADEVASGQTDKR